MPLENGNGKGRSELAALATTLEDPALDFASRYDAVRTYLDSLAKPPGSLGTLEDFAARIAALQRSATPNVDASACLVFAADHGVAREGSEGGMNCSAYPPAVSRKVLEGLDRGVAGANVLAKCNGVALRAVDVGLADGPAECEWSGDVVRSSGRKVKGGTENFCRGRAMTEEEAAGCVSSGRHETGKFVDETGAKIVLFGEVGIGNTTTSSALVAALTAADAESLCGIGASTTRDGIDESGAVARKASIVEEAMEFHGASGLRDEPLRALTAVGGAEIAAIVGGMLEASERDLPVLVDGFIVTAAAMVACRMEPSVARVLLFATRSTERGQAAALGEIRDVARRAGLPVPARPALDMDLRMGEGTGCLLAMPMARSACAILAELATLNEVLGLGGVSG
eukprot:CAMPEP_0172564388 /NCGR_PEP_ID=MMETSP1067-20121228/104163_1 /TAXON_ID=265564 ORGANISM="Thalassiosira punctigera, Strain Tpunct2005C2" /NCGR_SAMPLE_ID=MMETSP1067 /ASSEMBLY_ACC=CAM_ASM_000444 /LENGTH=398 /DNA_ID=CAMNT_0013355045 /DNA_START=33 /DNA_END=1229 /DNA_ORIENTATION=-